SVHYARDMHGTPYGAAGNPCEPNLKDCPEAGIREKSRKPQPSREDRPHLSWSQAIPGGSHRNQPMTLTCFRISQARPSPSPSQLAAIIPPGSQPSKCIRSSSYGPEGRYFGRLTGERKPHRLASTECNCSSIWMSGVTNEAFLIIMMILNSIFPPAMATYEVGSLH